MKTAEITVISGASGVGKDTIIQHLVREHGYKRVLSFTTRAPRPGERDGADYFFVSTEKFMDMKGKNELIDHVTITGNHYGISSKVIDRQLAKGERIVLNVVVGTGRLIKSLYRDTRLVFISPPSEEALTDRLIRRGMPLHEIEARYRENPCQNQAPEDYDIVVTNHDHRHEDAASAIAQAKADSSYRPKRLQHAFA